VTPLDRVVVVLDETQDLVNVALVVRAMKNMGFSRLRLVRAREFEPYRIEGIAHDTEDLVRCVEHFHTLDEALADATYVVGTTARRRASRQEWWDPESAARSLTSRLDAGDVAVLFGREDHGLSNERLDLCHALISIPVSPGHPSMNLAHAVLVILYELRKAIEREVGLEARDLSPKKRQATPPPSVAELEEFFERWEEAMVECGLFDGIDPVPKMRSFRAIFQRADMNRREIGLMRAVAFEVIHFARRVR